MLSSHPRHSQNEQPISEQDKVLVQEDLRVAFRHLHSIPFELLLPHTRESSEGEFHELQEDLEVRHTEVHLEENDRHSLQKELNFLSVPQNSLTYHLLAIPEQIAEDGH